MCVCIIGLIACQQVLFACPRRGSSFAPPTTPTTTCAVPTEGVPPLDTVDAATGSAAAAATHDSTPPVWTGLAAEEHAAVEAALQGADGFGESTRAADFPVLGAAQLNKLATHNFLPTFLLLSLPPVPPSPHPPFSPPLRFSPSISHPPSSSSPSSTPLFLSGSFSI